MSTHHDPLREDALRIWRAGVAAVDSARLVRDCVRVKGDVLAIAERELDLRAIQRIVVVGAGKAGAGMAAGFEQALGERLLDDKQVAGWINVPADCMRPLARIHLHAARPAGQNEPTAEGVAGAERILQLVGELAEDDLCVCLLSGGGSALLPAPVAGVTLADKLVVTRLLSAAGADIRQLNTVRKQLSRIKGGGLSRACRAGTLITLVISDVIGDPLDVIASGPTIDDPSTPREALDVLAQFGGTGAGFPTAVIDYLAAQAQAPHRRPAATTATHFVIGNNALAVDAAGQEAVRLGYSPALVSATQQEGYAEESGRHLAKMALQMRGAAGPDCLVSGGEPVVKLVPADRRGLGGRNQQLVLAACVALWDGDADGVALVSGGTDGEDGPTDAAGAVVDRDVIRAGQRLRLDPAEFLARDDAYRFFAATGGLIRTGPTHTNVCDLRVLVVDRSR